MSIKMNNKLGVQFVWINTLSLCFGLVAATYFDALDDTILHKINWAGPLPDEILDHQLDSPSLNSIVMTTARNEKYRCTLPNTLEHSGDDIGPYTGPSPLELLAPLFTQFACTFKLETYWTYELCHGKYIRQYHEEREGKKVKLQEFFLGRWGKDDPEKAKFQIESDFSNPDYKSQIPTKKIDGVNMPYLQINMTDGTVCDLNGQTRSTRVLYVCYPFGKHEIYSLEETSTCEYEIVVLSQNLCQHPDFKSRETGENTISCHSLKNAPKLPKALVELEAESFKIRHEHLLQNLESLLETKIKGDVRPVELFTDDDDSMLKPLKPSLHDNSFLTSFLSGKSCLTGGSHWWKFEFCFGKHVLQFHEEPNSPSRTEIFLGKWDEDKHKEFLDKNPHKKSISLASKKQVVHYYTGGAACDQSGEPRIVEVKFKCVDNPSPSAIALYLLEPKTCEYTLGVESSVLCPLLQGSDDYGLFDTSAFSEVVSEKTTVETLSKDKTRHSKDTKTNSDKESSTTEKIKGRKFSDMSEMDMMPMADDDAVA